MAATCLLLRFATCVLAKPGRIPSTPRRCHCVALGLCCAQVFSMGRAGERWRRIIGSNSKISVKGLKTLYSNEHTHVLDMPPALLDSWKPRRHAERDSAMRGVYEELLTIGKQEKKKKKRDGGSGHTLVGLRLHLTRTWPDRRPAGPQVLRTPGSLRASGTPPPQTRSSPHCESSTPRPKPGE